MQKHIELKIDRLENLLMILKGLACCSIEPHELVNIEAFNKQLDNCKLTRGK